MRASRYQSQLCLVVAVALPPPVNAAPHRGIAPVMRHERCSDDESDSYPRIGYLFVEVSPSLIAACARLAGGSTLSANQLYQDTLADHIPRVREWEQAVEHLL